MAGYPWVCFSSLLPCREMSPEDPPGRSDCGDGGASMADTAMVSSAIGEPGRLSDTAINSSRHVEEPIQRQAPPDGSLQVATSRLEARRMEFQRKLQSSSNQGGAKEPMWPISQYGTNGVAGVRGNKLIPFHAKSISLSVS